MDNSISTHFESYKKKKPSLNRYIDIVKKIGPAKDLFFNLFEISIHVENKRYDNVEKSIKELILSPILLKSLQSQNNQVSKELDEYMFKCFKILRNRLNKNALTSFIKYLSFFNWEGSELKTINLIKELISEIKIDKSQFNHSYWGFPHLNIWISDIFKSEEYAGYMKYYNIYFQYYFKKENLINIINSASSLMPYTYKSIYFKALSDFSSGLSKSSLPTDQIIYFSLCEYQNLQGKEIGGKKLIDENCLSNKREFYQKLNKTAPNTSLKNYSVFKLMELGDFRNSYL